MTDAVPTEFNEWQQTAATYDGAELTLYRQHEDVASVEESNPPVTDSDNLLFGALYHADGNLIDFLEGSIDAIRLSNRALTGDEMLHYPLVDWTVGSANWTLDCGGNLCPILSGYKAYCNAKAHCEYARTEQIEDWHQWDIWVYVPPGAFLMGGPIAEGGHDNERPVHSVSVENGFYIAKYEIGVGHYEGCALDVESGCTAPEALDWIGEHWPVNSSSNGYADHPQNGLSWEQANSFCQWASPGGRLPSEAEWEYAATGPSHKKYPWGNSPSPACGNQTAVFNEGGNTASFGCSQGGTWKLGSMSAGTSWCGAMDMSGNVWEWTLDWWHESYDDAPKSADPWLSPASSKRVLRGGGFHDGADELTSANRSSASPTDQSSGVGARCVRPVD